MPLLPKPSGVSWPAAGRCITCTTGWTTSSPPPAHVSQLVPGARVGIAHGKMTEEELNPVWQHLLNGEIDILVCTTLIETGIDVRNCNTLIIEDADRMGLAQLYQIRGPGGPLRPQGLCLLHLPGGTRP